ncbi:MAG: 50S ribosomal protein L11 methyltransferase [Bacteroidota bacterium]
MDYVELTCQTGNQPGTDEPLIALLGEVGYEMFEEFDGGFKAYIAQANFNEGLLTDLRTGVFLPGVKVLCSFSLIPHRNWNEVWESNFEPVIISNRLLIRAEYHPPNPNIGMELVVQPRMAFGTGHHATTHQMLERMLEVDFSGKSVLDIGCGTGILAILAKKLGASDILAVDFDPNSVENTAENCKVNQVEGIQIYEGTMSDVGTDQFHIILANINRNIILQDLTLYEKHLANGGMLFTSGYYTDDLPMISDAAARIGLNLTKSGSKENWCCSRFQKNVS